MAWPSLLAPMGRHARANRPKNNGSRPKSTEPGPGFSGSPHGSPQADLIFLSDTRGLCMECNISAKNPAAIQNWRGAGAAAHFH